MQRSASTPAVPTSKTASDELGQALNRQHRKFYANNINDDALVPMFQQWAKSNLCSENVDFFLEVASYKRACQKRGHKIDIKKEADNIFHKYISLGAPQEINISYVVRVHILRYIGEPNSKTFDEAQTHILELMEVDVFPRFFRTPEFLARYRPVPDPLPPLKKTPTKPPQSNDTKSRSASLKTYFKKVIPISTTRSGRSQSNIDDTLPEKVSDNDDESPRSNRSRTPSLKGDESPRSRSRTVTIQGDESPRSRSRTIVSGDESPRSNRSRTPSLKGDESPRSGRSRATTIQGDESPQSTRSRNNSDDSPRVRSHTVSATEEDGSSDCYLSPTSATSDPTSPRGPGSPRPSSQTMTHKEAEKEKEKEKEKRSNSFPYRMTGVFTLRGFARHGKFFKRKSGEIEDFNWDEDHTVSGWSSPAISPRVDPSPVSSPRAPGSPRDSPEISPPQSASNTPRGTGTPPLTPRSAASVNAMRPPTPRASTLRNPSPTQLDANAAQEPKLIIPSISIEPPPSLAAPQALIPSPNIPPSTFLLDPTAVTSTPQTTSSQPVQSEQIPQTKTESAKESMPIDVIPNEKTKEQPTEILPNEKTKEITKERSLDEIIRTQAPKMEQQHSSRALTSTAREVSLTVISESPEMLSDVKPNTTTEHANSNTKTEPNPIVNSTDILPSPSSSTKNRRSTSCPPVPAFVLDEQSTVSSPLSPASLPASSPTSPTSVPSTSFSTPSSPISSTSPSFAVSPVLDKEPAEKRKRKGSRVTRAFKSLFQSSKSHQPPQSNPVPHPKLTRRHSSHSCSSQELPVFVTQRMQRAAPTCP